MGVGFDVHRFEDHRSLVHVTAEADVDDGLGQALHLVAGVAALVAVEVIDDRAVGGQTIGDGHGLGTGHGLVAATSAHKDKGHADNSQQQ